MSGFIITRRLSVLVLCLLAVSAVAIGAAGDWAIYRGPQHNGISAEADWLAGGPKVLWSANVGTACSSMTVVDGKLYTMGNKANKDIVFCFDAVTGRPLWNYSYPEPLTPKLYEGGPNATPTVDDGKVYTISKTGKVFCLDAAKGTKLWQAQLAAKAPKWGYSGSALVVENLLIINSGPGGTALDKTSGKVIWASGDAAGGYSTPVPFQREGQTHVAMFTATSAVAVRVSDGKNIWSHPWKTSYDVNAADPVLVEDGKKVFISSGYGSGCALLNVSGAAPKEIWRNKNMKNKHTNSILYKGSIYGFDESKELVCLDLATGEKKWAKDGMGMGAIALADEKLIILSDKGKLVIAKATADGYSELASVQAVSDKCWAAPIIAGGRIYARGKKGALACVTFSK